MPTRTSRRWGRTPAVSRPGTEASPCHMTIHPDRADDYLLHILEAISRAMAYAQKAGTVTRPCSEKPCRTALPTADTCPLLAPRTPGGGEFELSSRLRACP